MDTQTYTPEFLEELRKPMRRSRLARDMVPYEFDPTKPRDYWANTFCMSHPNLEGRAHIRMQGDVPPPPESRPVDLRRGCKQRTRRSR